MSFRVDEYLTANERKKGNPLTSHHPPHLPSVPLTFFLDGELLRVLPGLDRIAEERDRQQRGEGELLQLLHLSSDEDIPHLLVNSPEGERPGEMEAGGGGPAHPGVRPGTWGRRSGRIRGGILRSYFRPIINLYEKYWLRLF